MTETPDTERTRDQEQGQSQPTATNGDRIAVVTPTGMGIADVPPPGVHPGQEGEAENDDEDGPRRPTDLVEQPAKVMRIGSMVKSLLEEVRNAPLDEAGRGHLAQVHARSIEELKQGLAPELVEELDRIALPFSDDSPSDAELRIAQAQLVGWLEGLFHGIQTALVAQQMAAQATLQQMRQLPPGVPPGQPGAPPPAPRHEGTGQYL